MRVQAGRFSEQTAAPAEALELLDKASRWHRGNPKPQVPHCAIAALNLAGDLEQGGLQLQTVQRQCQYQPQDLGTSGDCSARLDRRYADDARFERKASARLFWRNCWKQVRDGIDVVPAEMLSLAPTPAQVAGGSSTQSRNERLATGVAAEKIAEPQARRTDAGLCRWSGVYDLQAEQLLEAEPTVRNRDLLVGILAELVNLAPLREGGFSAFAITSIQWLLNGYPSGADSGGLWRAGRTMRSLRRQGRWAAR